MGIYQRKFESLEIGDKVQCVDWLDLEWGSVLEQNKTYVVRKKQEYDNPHGYKYPGVYPKKITMVYFEGLDDRYYWKETRFRKVSQTAEDYLRRHAVLDGRGNMDGMWVPISVAMIAIEHVINGKLEPAHPTWIKRDKVCSKCNQNLTMFTADLDSCAKCKLTVEP